MMRLKCCLLLLTMLLTVTYTQIGVADEKRTDGKFQRHFLCAESKGDPWFGEDKFKHLMASALIAGLGYNIARYDFHNPRPNAIIMGCGISLSAGITKEIWDLHRPGGTCSYRDLIADLVGVALGVLLVTETIGW